MQNYLRFLICILLFSDYSFAQLSEKEYELKELNIVSQKDKYLTGGKFEKIDSLQLSSVSGENLTEALTRNFSIYIKQDAGGLSTIRFRGTSPDHTAILFNGININSYTLGHSNISAVPVFLFDEIKVQYGSSSSLYGSDAIGGSIHLNNNPEWNKGLKIYYQQNIGSFKTFFEGLKVGYSTKRFQINIKAFHQQKENNFQFTNIAVRDFVKNEFVRDTTRNAAIKNNGLLTEMFYKITDKTYSYLKIWYENNWHQIQPNMSANYYGGSFDEIKDEHLRTIAGIKHYNGNHKINFDLGYITDNQIYNENLNEMISVQSFIANLNYFNSNFWKGDLNIGVNNNYLIPDVYAYKGNTTETRSDIFLQYIKLFFGKLHISLNVRETMVSNYKNSFTPALGADYIIFSDINQSLNLKLLFSESYKTPTFNQRYWYPNGNPDILPEKGRNYEINAVYKYKTNNQELKLSSSLFLIDIDNLIQWMNLDIWRPVNVKKARNKGIELSTTYEIIVNQFKIKSFVNYSYIKATEIKSYEKTGTTGKQLIYTPEHTANSIVTINYKNCFFMLNNSFTGDRFTETYKILDAYFLQNASLGGNFNFGKNTVSVNFTVNNIFNKAYQNQEFYAMPGINYTISIKLLINNLKINRK